MNRHHRNFTAGALWRRNGLVWVALMLLLLLTVALAYAPWGGLTTAGGLVIAIVKTALVVAWFMELATAKSLLRLVALAGVVFLLVLFGLTLADTLARHFGS